VGGSKVLITGRAADCQGGARKLMHEPGDKARHGPLSPRLEAERLQAIQSSLVVPFFCSKKYDLGLDQRT
jgi:hypothetical protein